jgi:plasmid maintenance system antidote protein VapI
MEKVEKLIEAGARLGIAIREALLTDRNLTVAGLADKYSLNEKAVSNAINGNIRASDGVVAALVAELGGTPDGWRMLLWKSSKPEQAGV